MTEDPNINRFGWSEPDELERVPDDAASAPLDADAILRQADERYQKRQRKLVERAIELSRLRRRSK